MPSSNANAAENAGVNDATENAAQQQQQPQAKSLLGSLFRMFLMYYAMKSIFPSFLGSSNSAQNNSQGQAPLQPLWPLNTPTTLSVYLSETSTLTQTTAHTMKPLYQQSLVFGSWDYDYKASFNVTPSYNVQHNGSLYAHLVLQQSSSAQGMNAERVVVKSVLLTRYMPKKKEIVKKRLFGNGDDKGVDGRDTNGNVDVDGDIRNLENHTDTGKVDVESPKIAQPIVSYWYPNLTIALVSDNQPIPRAMHPAMVKHIQVTRDLQHYYPIMYINEFFMLDEHLSLINNTVQQLPLHIEIYPLSLLKFQLYTQMTESFRIQKDMFGSTTSEIDDLKRMFLETNPILLVTTFLVSILHSIFDFLAFKNDIQFWKTKNDLDGLSLRSILLNVAFQTIILLYLFDNETSWMILISSVIGLLIEIWKVKRVATLSITWTNNNLPKLTFNERNKTKKTEITDEYDQQAFKYLSIALSPALVGYAMYSAYYDTHKSFYSYIITTLVQFVYFFGFVSMTPQLFINYKLKTVAHMPWRTFMYKALNTFIDDMFAFVIKMPTLHRLACFRDDVVFVIYLYQRWIYPEDHTRRNEFGQVGVVDDDAKKEDGDLKKKDDGKTVEKDDGKTEVVLSDTITSVPKNVKKDQDSTLRKRNVGTSD